MQLSLALRGGAGSTCSVDEDNEALTTPHKPNEAQSTVPEAGTAHRSMGSAAVAQGVAGGVKRIGVDPRMEGEMGPHGIRIRQAILVISPSAPHHYLNF